ncbi:MAG: hypothetical protein U0S13_06320 [Mycobacterium sp.]
MTVPADSPPVPPVVAEAALLGAYGLQPDAIRLDYYRRLWAAPG